MTERPMAGTTTDSLYDSPELYDQFSTGVPGDVEYFAGLARRCRTVLELACGTGRVTAPMAEAGASVVGLDASAAMLEAASKRIAALPAAARKRVTLAQGDMRGFDLGRTFPLIVIPYRAFSHLIEVPDQRACLECCREHLAPRGRLVVNLFDPNLKVLAFSLTPAGSSVRQLRELETPDGGRILVTVARTPCPEEQRFQENWIYEAFDRDGRSLWRRCRQIHLRYFYRYEMEHLFERCGLRVEKLEGGFCGQPYHHGGEQIWTVRRA